VGVELAPDLGHFRRILLFRLLPREARFVAGFARAYTVDLEELKEAAAVRFSP
jgi:hypothetical protein